MRLYAVFARTQLRSSEVQIPIPEISAMKSKTALSLCVSLALVCCTSISKADITSVTFAGALSNDASVFDYTFTDTATDSLDFYTTSYGGGTNANGTVASA